MQTPVPPSITKAAFSCPHCGAYTTQYWYETWATEVEGENPVPLLVGEQMRQMLLRHRDLPQDVVEDQMGRIAKHEEGLVLLEQRNGKSFYLEASNLHLSKCLHCSKVAVWVRDSIVFPPTKEAVLPNQDLPSDIIRDFEEARSVVGVSPRGATALLRLCIQKLCTHLLGPESDDINKDIGLLVKRGLSPMVQEALDTVRVIGNESVHPGTMDLRDDRDTALALFNLVNLIADRLITHPKEVNDLYKTLPQGKLKGIEARDKPTNSQNP